MSCPTCGTDHHAAAPAEAEAELATAEVHAEAMLAAEEISAEASTERNADDNDTREEIARIEAEARVEEARVEAAAAVAIAEAGAAAEVATAEALADAIAGAGDDDDQADEHDEEGQTVGEEQTTEAGAGAEDGATPIPVSVPPQLEDDPTPAATAGGAGQPRRVSRFRSHRRGVGR